MSFEILPFDDVPSLRRRAAMFLAERFRCVDAGDADQWLRRMAHWWDANPSAVMHASRGWWIESAGEMCAFVGVIPRAYRLNGERVTGLAGTSWVMDAGCRGECIRMALKFQGLGDEGVLVATTPRAEVRALLRKGGWMGCGGYERWIVPAWPVLRRFFLRDGGPPMAGARFTTDVAKVAGVGVRALPEGVLSPEVSVETLRWYVASPAREHHFAGWVDEAGVLLGYVIVIPTLVRWGLAWEVVEAGSTEEGFVELGGLISRMLARLPSRPWLVLNGLSPATGEAWAGILPVRRSKPEETAFFRAPEGMAVKGKCWQMTEGDQGL